MSELRTVTLKLPADFTLPVDLSPEDARLVLTAGLRTLEYCRELARPPTGNARDQLPTASIGVPLPGAAGSPTPAGAAAPPPSGQLAVRIGETPAAERPSEQSAPVGHLSQAGELAALTRRLDILLGTGAGGATSSLKGAAAESVIESLLLRRYPKAELEACGKTPGRGDFLLRREGAPSLLVEVKNVARVPTAEIEKFERDLGSSGVADGGIFVSCESRPLPRIGPFGLRMCPGPPAPSSAAPGGTGPSGGRPAIFIVGALATPALVEFAVALLDFLVPALARRGKAGTPESVQAAQEAVNRAYASYLSTVVPLRRIRDRLTLVGLDVQSLEATTAAAIANLRQLWDRHPELRSAAQVGDATAGGADNLARVPAAAPNGAAVPPGEESGPARGEIGSEACEAAVRAFIEANGRSPTRPEVIKACGISDSTLRSLGGSRALVARARAALK